MPGNERTAEDLPSIFDDSGDWADEETAEIFGTSAPNTSGNITSITRKTVPAVRDRVREEMLRMQLMYPLNNAKIAYRPDNDPELPYNNPFIPIPKPPSKPVDDNPFTNSSNNDHNPFT